MEIIGDNELYIALWMLFIVGIGLTLTVIIMFIYDIIRKRKK